MSDEEIEQRISEGESIERNAAHEAAGGSYHNLTVRDFFAAQAMSAMMAACSGSYGTHTAESAYQMADWMLAERNKSQ